VSNTGDVSSIKGNLATPCITKALYRPIKIINAPTTIILLRPLPAAVCVSTMNGPQVKPAYVINLPPASSAAAESKVSSPLVPSPSGLFNAPKDFEALHSRPRHDKDNGFSNLSPSLENSFQWCNTDDSFFNSVDIDSLLDCIAPPPESDLFADDPLGELDEYLHDSAITNLTDPPFDYPLLEKTVITHSFSKQGTPLPSSLKRVHHDMNSFSSKRPRCDSPSPASVCSTTTSVSDPLYDAYNRLLDRQRKNNEASRKSRALKKERVQSMEEEISSLERENEVWEKRLSEVSRVAEQCKEILVQHFKQTAPSNNEAPSFNFCFENLL
jgi:hypothetical protein